MYVHVGAPKMRRLGARRVHIRIDVPQVVQFFEALSLRSSPRLPLMNGGARVFRACLDSLMDFSELNIRTRWASLPRPSALEGPRFGIDSQTRRTGFATEVVGFPVEC